MKFNDRIAAAASGKTSLEEKCIAIRRANIRGIASRLRKRAPRIIAYLQSSGCPKSANEIRKGLKLATDARGESKKSAIISL